MRSAGVGGGAGPSRATRRVSSCRATAGNGRTIRGASGRRTFSGGGNFTVLKTTLLELELQFRGAVGGDKPVSGGVALELSVGLQNKAGLGIALQHSWN